MLVLKVFDDQNIQITSSDAIEIDATGPAFFIKAPGKYFTKVIDRIPLRTFIDTFPMSPITFKNIFHMEKVLGPNPQFERLEKYIPSTAKAIIGFSEIPTEQRMIFFENKNDIKNFLQNVSHPAREGFQSWTWYSTDSLDRLLNEIVSSSDNPTTDFKVCNYKGEICLLSNSGNIPRIVM